MNARVVLSATHVSARWPGETHVTVARENRADEERMAKKIDANWDRVADLSLTESGVTA
jgi:hypothetical protein